MALYDLYKFISESSILEASAPLYTTIEIPDTEVSTVEETITEEVNGEQVEKVVTREVRTPVNRTVEVVISNPQESDFRKAGFKNLQEGRIPAEEPTEEQYIKVTYVDGEKITVNKDIENKEVVQEEKPTEPLDDYHFYEAYIYHTETKIIHSWRVAEKEIVDVTVLDEQLQYRGTEYTDIIEETQVKRTYQVIDKTVINDPDVAPEDYKESWYTKEEYTRYDATEIHKGYTYTATQRRHIDHLECTKRIFQLCLKEMKGITYTQLTAIIDSNDDLASEYHGCIQLLRGNEGLDQVAPTFGLTSEDIDNIFLYANNEINLAQLKGE